MQLLLLKLQPMLQWLLYFHAMIFEDSLLLVDEPLYMLNYLILPVLLPFRSLSMVELDVMDFGWQ